MNNAETMKHARAALGKTAADVAVDGAVERLGNALWDSLSPSRRTPDLVRLHLAAPDLLIDGEALNLAAWKLLGFYRGQSFTIPDTDQSEEATIIRAFLDASAKHRAAIARAEGGVA